MNIKEFSEEYLEKLKGLMDNVSREKVEEIANALWSAYENDKTVFVLGNGGSASTASHFACDIAKGTTVEGKKRFKMVCLSDNIPLMTAWGNDTAYENIFSEQLKNLVKSGDVVLCISCSGNSKNVLSAIKLGNNEGAVTIGLTGFDGGKLKDDAKICLTVDSNSMRRIEDVHLLLLHLISEHLHEKVKE